MRVWKTHVVKLKGSRAVPHRIPGLKMSCRTIGKQTRLCYHGNKMCPATARVCAAALASLGHKGISKSSMSSNHTTLAALEHLYHISLAKGMRSMCNASHFSSTQQMLQSYGYTYDLRCTLFSILTFNRYMLNDTGLYAGLLNSISLVICNHGYR